MLLFKGNCWFLLNNLLKGNQKYFTRLMLFLYKILKVKVELSMTINLKNQTGAIKTAPTGFSWTMLFFGCFVPLFRGDFKWFFMSLAGAFVTLGIAWFVMPFIYNKRYISNLLESGYTPSDDISQKELISRGMFSDNNKIIG